MSEQEHERQTKDESELIQVTDKLMRAYGRSGSGRASALRLISVYFLYRQTGYAGLRRYGFSRGSIALYMEKLREAGVLSGK